MPLIIFCLSALSIVPTLSFSEIPDIESSGSIEVHEAAAVMQKAFSDVGSSISVLQYMETLKRQQLFKKLGLDHDMARMEKVSGFNKEEWATADRGMGRALCAIQLMRAGISLIKTLDALECAKNKPIRNGLDVLLAGLRAANQDVDSTIVAQVMEDALKVQDAGGEGWVIFAANDIDINSIPTSK